MYSDWLLVDNGSVFDTSVLVQWLRSPLLCQCDGTPVVVAYRDWMLGCNRITYVICYELAPSVQIFLMEDRSILLKQSGRSKRG